MSATRAFPFVFFLCYLGASISSVRGYSRCRSNFFQCENGQCINGSFLCNGAVDCRDGSDETLTICSQMRRCPSDMFRCEYGACVSKSATCNGVQDCADNSDELLPECKARLPCREGQFLCNSGQCISESRRCNGRSDCYDGSDETLAHCVNVRCQTGEFQCSYGGCIDENRMCNGYEDCRDGSDEETDLCEERREKPIHSQSNSPSTPWHSNSRLEGCELPPRPAGGHYEVMTCGKETNCPRRPGSRVALFTVIRFTCTDGNSLEGGSLSVCGEDGEWTPKPPECLKLCPPLNSSSEDYSCRFGGEDTDCSNPCRPGTRARVTCHAAYHPADFNPSARTAECLPSGQWSSSLLRCQPDCGIKNFSPNKLISLAPDAIEGEYPWHAALYREHGKKYVCGGSIITEEAVLTAAHCVFDERTGKKVSNNDLQIAVGKYRRSFSVMDPGEQRFSVNDIILHDNYTGRRGLWENDISVIFLNGRIIFKTSVMPICIDHYLTFRIRNSNIGTVVGWGLTETGRTSDVLRVARLPYYDLQSCRKTVTLDLAPYITDDKLCAGLRNGTHMGRGDSGGGLAFPRSTAGGDERYFLYGVVSVTGREDPSIAGFTNVTTHLPWLRDLLGIAQRQPRPS